MFPLMPTVVIYGSRSRSPIVWKAELEINAFVDAALGVAECVYAPFQSKQKGRIEKWWKRLRVFGRDEVKKEKIGQ